ncbi:MAG: DinB family protein [Planctomycetes bacterium]|nr:DinB family protein [Planctomycetota bacterium]
MAGATVERGDSQKYQDKLLGLLGDRDPVAVLAETPNVVRRIAAEHPAELLRRRPYPGKWTPCEVIGHLCDSEWVYGYRIRLILCEKEPTILGMNQDDWVAGQRYNERDPRELAEQFAAMRRFNLHIWANLTAADRQRAGLHNERGRETLGMMVRMEAGHDLSHIDQITRYVEAARKM